MNQNSTLANLIVTAASDNKAYYIGVKNLNTGRYDSPLTPELSANELSTLLSPANSDNTLYNINAIEVLNLYSTEIKKWISEENNQLFNKFIEYEKEGALRSFKTDFSRILDGNLSEGSPLPDNIIKLFSYYKNKFLETKKEIYNKNYRQWEINIEQIEDNFHSAIIILIINIFIQYYRKDNKKYFAEDPIISTDIADIRRHLEGMINDDDLLALLTQQVCIDKNLTLLNKNNIIRNQDISELNLYQKLKFYHQWDGYDNRWNFICNPHNYDYPQYGLPFHERLLDLLNILNNIAFLYQGLLESCTQETSTENQYMKEVVLFLQGEQGLLQLNPRKLIEF